MYQTARNQRFFIPSITKGQGKISRASIPQVIYNPETGETKKTRHTGMPFKSTGAIIKFMARHGIRPGTLIANGWKLPKGNALKAERLKIKAGISTLSRAQCEVVMEN